MQLGNLLVIQAGNLGGEKNLSNIQKRTISKDVNEQFKLAQRFVDVVDHANIKVCVNTFRYNFDKSGSSYAQVRLFARKTEEKNFQQLVDLEYKFHFFLYLLVIVISVHVKIFANQSICKVLGKVIAIILSLSLFLVFESGRAGRLVIIGTSFRFWTQNLDFIRLY